MTNEEARKRIRKALAAIAETPGALSDYLLMPYPGLPKASPVDLPQMHGILLSSDVNDPERLAFGNLLRQWDNSLEGDWIGGTDRNTGGRRRLIYGLLETNKSLNAKIDEQIPHYSIGEPLLIATEHKPWYEPEKTTRTFYWSAYKLYLKKNRGWPDESVLNLDNATRAIVERLGNPEDRAAFKSRGLVVGYVQSGKTANFTGVIAKAADSGYRLIIVLAGTWNILRNQTQRRLDKELVGQELLEGQDGYQPHPEDWKDFIVHGALPETLGSFNWERLTGLDDDYKRLGAAVGALDFQIQDKNKPLYDPVNLHKSPVRLIVMKKHPAIIKRLSGDLSAIRVRLADVPTLIIDDESDQAGINTAAPDKVRKATNREIVKLLKMLPRGQYIGYTATPYANVLVDPGDEEDIFPRDFILSLDRPTGYMGISDFFDTESDADSVPQNDFSHKERAFVRDAGGSKDADDSDSLKKAIGSFVLSGAIKLYREKQDSARYRFPHHTMLVHTGAKQEQHRDDEDRIKEILNTSAFSSPSGVKFLKELWEEDYLPVIKAQGADELSPAAFGRVIPFIGPCLDRLNDGVVVRVLNSDSKNPAPDFNKDSVWEILVGGNKLSRGYTVEGLTISYYSRTASNADTLMQMGRWFGFRSGYRDLVRIFVGRKQGKKNIDLVDSFKQACLMEERFREDIRRYAVKSDGKPLRPIDVPPLIAITGDLQPTARNKMWNAIITAKNFGDQWSMPTRMPDRQAAMQENLSTAETFWNSGGKASRVQFGGRYSGGNPSVWPAVVRETKLPALIRFLEGFQWLEGMTPADIALQIEFLKKGKHGISSCLLIAPQLQTSDKTWIGGLTIKRRKRLANGRFQLFGEPLHRAVAEYLTDRKGREDSFRYLETPQRDTAAFKAGNRAVFMLYPVLPDNGEKLPTIGFELLYSGNNLPTGLVYTTRAPVDVAAINV